MIILETHTEQRPQQHPQQANSPPPSYDAASLDATAGLPPPPPSYPKLPSYLDTGPTASGSSSRSPHQHDRYTRSPAKRFCKAFALAFLVYLLLLSLTHTIVHMASSGTHRHQWDDGPGVPRSEDGRVVDSIGHLNWTTYHPHPRWAPNFAESADTSFNLPLSADTLYLVSRGSHQGGKVVLRQATDRGELESGQVRVDVRVAYQHTRALARVSVCRLRKTGNRHGIGIYTPILGWADARDRLWFEVVWTFPAAPSDRAPVHVHHLQTHAGNFAHEMGDLWRSLVFDNLELDASNSPIRAESVTLARGFLTTSNGAIVGHFNTSDALVLRTSNGRIQSTASLFSTDRSPAKLDMRTSNGPIDASISLATSSASGGIFTVIAHSSNGGVKVHYDDAPSGSKLVSDVQTSNGRAAVSMHPTFEGTYAVSTSNGKPVVRDMGPGDPLGLGRRRVVDRRTVGGRVEGRVYWAGEEGRRGEGVSTVRTSNAPASLDL